MPKFKKKPVVVEAVQWNGESPLPEGCTYGQGESFDLACCFVTTIHGQATRVVPGDWIITEPDGKHYYPCKPNIFEATYEAVDAEVISDVDYKSSYRAAMESDQIVSVEPHASDEEKD